MLLIRAERAANDPTRDRKKSQHVEIWQKELDELLKKKDLSPKARNRLWNLFWMMQEFKVSCYAQELGTSEPVSDKRLKDAISEIKKLF
jgi:ATP-dependent helicase HrpA